MLEKDKLRKADIYTSVIIFFIGLWIVLQALKMPMKDSWGGVQNVWYVSPALFPLFVGCMIMILGVLLFRTAFKAVGLKEFIQTSRWLMSKALLQFLNTVSNLRFYAIAVLFFSFVYLTIPRVDFFLSATLFLIVFITSFYFDDTMLLKKLFFFYLAGVVILIVYYAVGLDGALAETVPFPGDILVLCFTIAYTVTAWMMIRTNPVLRKKFRTALIVAVTTPFVLGMIFKYFLMVPMPSEGLVVTLIDYLWYLEF